MSRRSRATQARQGTAGTTIHCTHTALSSAVLTVDSDGRFRMRMRRRTSDALETNTCAHRLDTTPTDAAQERRLVAFSRSFCSDTTMDDKQQQCVYGGERAREWERERKRERKHGSLTHSSSLCSAHSTAEGFLPSGYRLPSITTQRTT